MFCHYLYFFVVSFDVASCFDIISVGIQVTMSIPGYLLTSFDYHSRAITVVVIL